MFLLAALKGIVDALCAGNPKLARAIAGMAAAVAWLKTAAAIVYVWDGAKLLIIRGLIGIALFLLRFFPRPRPSGRRRAELPDVLYRPPRADD